MVMRLLMDKGDAILCEEYTYPHVAESFVQPQGYTAVPLSMDSYGIVPSLFRQTMESLRAAGKPLPRLLYTVPVGQNPTGQSLVYICELHPAITFCLAYLITCVAWKALRS